MRHWKQIIKDLSIRKKLLLCFGFTSLLLLISNLLLYKEVNRSINRIDQIYVSNITLNDLSDALTSTHEDVYEYLSTKSSSALENYYRSGQQFRDLLEDLNGETRDNSMLLLEKNIKNMSDTYLATMDNTVAAKRGRNIQRYKDCYAEAEELYRYITSYIDNLNRQQFQVNSSSYKTLLVSLQYMEVVSTAILIFVAVVNIIFLVLLTQSIIGPLILLARTADEVAEGNLNAPLLEVTSADEVGTVTKAFNQMVYSIRDHIQRTKESMEKEQRMMERELLMKNHLKDAQLKYLQAQINPHFLFNSLNAGAQLAMMEDAEKTCLFVERMADFFRYNVRKMSEDATLGEELEAVDNYIYILNVRFAGDINYIKETDAGVEDIRVPSMILQPIVENSVNYGIRHMEGEGYIHVTVKREDGEVIIRIKDNGKGMEPEKIQAILENTLEGHRGQSDSTGIGINNVKSRMELYYDRKGLLQIESRGQDQGTVVSLIIPLETA
ncbi:HAMP domain-containing protein [Lactonifactor longoviformis]|uniref:histidine kinase n=1 Tax=Lactonifactor longoviformis DSM 17459 TaxID=1122155 RepID=A0A1M4YZE1_9CLOT|nr:histidine kinase [Lactonifactor longoviformis]POP33886.1 HAMP domain-containing protein [Lactonifactor longoviformis]SHF11110.1 HAMP domain-containing protein [Lactonifactor longoviformis DSM 17459]